MQNLRRKTDRQLTPEEQGWATTCEAGGGIYRGTMEYLVLFDSKQTGSTLVLKATDLTPDAVRQHIAESNAKFGVK